MPFASALIVLLIALPLTAQKNTPSSPGLAIEDELDLQKGKGSKKKKTPTDNQEPEDIADKTTTVEGEDEQYAPPRKSDIELPKLADGAASRWDEAVGSMSAGEQQGTKLLERKAQIKAEYGTQNALGARIFITKKDEVGTYLIDYTRNKYDHEAFGRSVTANSAFSHDHLKLLGQMNISQGYKMLLRTEYLESGRGLQGNTAYSAENKKLGVFQWDNQVRPSDNQRITAGITGSLARGSVAPVGLAQNTLDANFKNIKGSVEWQYIFGERNALTILGDLWYGENADYLTQQPQYYRGGNGEIRNVFPLARFLLGSENQALQVDATVGAKLFFAQGFQPVIGPRVALDFFYPGYQGTLELERTGQLPDVEKYFFTPVYQAPYRFFQAEDLWRAAFKNNFHLTKETHLKVSATLINYPVYFDRRLDSATGLLQLNPMSYRALQGSVSLAQNFGTDFWHDTGLAAEYFIDQASLREPLALFTRLHYTPNTWDFSLEMKYVHNRRETDMNTLTTRDLNGYLLLGAGIEKALLPSLKAFIRGENLLNQKYEFVSLYRTSGARGWFGLSIVF
ncbi:MAG: hypothetical protein ACOY5B_15015 [Spirochaetota bacterium]